MHKNFSTFVKPYYVLLRKYEKFRFGEKEMK